jgi:AraC family transcriptional regulator
MHLQVTALAFTRLMDDYNLPALPGRSILHSFGLGDEVINRIGLSVLSEMMCPTAAGRMLVETSSLLLAARLVHTHSEAGFIRQPIQSGHRLDEGRLRRVLAYSKST